MCCGGKIARKEKTTLLKCMPHPEAKVQHNKDGSIFLISCQAKAAEISSNGWLTIYHWNDRMTKLHIAAFLDEYIYGLGSRAEQNRANTGAYQTAKALYEGNLRMDINTGEVVDCTENHVEIIYTYDKETDYYTPAHNAAMDYLIRHLSGVSVIAEADNLVQVSVDENASAVLDDLTACDMLRSWKGKTINQVKPGE